MRKQNDFTPGIPHHYDHLITIHFKHLREGIYNQLIPTGDLVLLAPADYERLLTAIREEIPLTLQKTPENAPKFIVLAALLAQMSGNNGRDYAESLAEDYGIDKNLALNVEYFLDSLEKVNNYWLVTGEPFNLETVRVARTLAAAVPKPELDTCLQALVAAMHADHQTAMAAYQKVIDAGKGKSA